MFYCLDALYGERRDRSLLFWKSLPLSDRTAVLAKALIPLAVLPFLAYAISVATQILLMTIGAPVLTSSHVTLSGMLGAIEFFELQVTMVYGLSVHALWFAPIYGWLLLVSSWARRAPFLWALLPVVALLTLERMAFNTTYFQNMIVYRLNGAMKEAFDYQRAKPGHSERLADLQLLNFLTTPGLWVGLAFAALCVAAAIRLRHTREAI
jgi:ABC-2 type transport system permease protein